MKKIKIKNKYIGEGSRCFIIAEAGSNHDGKLDQAKRLIEIAADAGVDAVKFQLFKAEELYPKNCGKVDTPAGKIDLYKALKKMELPGDWLRELKKYSEKCGLIFLCAPFSEKAALELNNIDIDAFKIASPELSHLPLLRYVASFGKLMIISTGISKMADIEEAIEACRSAGNNNIVLMHCVTAYPAPLKDCNLNVIATMKMAFGLPVGFSDHTEDPLAAPVVSLLAGCNLIEKHFTPNKKLPGPDHPFALEPNELKAMVKGIRKVEAFDKNQQYLAIMKMYGEKKVMMMLGLGIKTIASSEKDLAACDRRSIRAINKISKHERFTPKNLGILRSERNLKLGIHPRYWDILIGKKAVKCIPAGKEIVWKDFIK
ncbi:hypothetical protein A2276_06110 [candidate division WOR-1 bacterium RIFOXYA12_FULL_43_27]|uniref:AFP-like domain-containing protein n=1 Tax=candidate division WOR-1 bacterium RIFOXYC2_FULL_46_14 TaxID=1802587 RepID=A0A1F4U567_UNCSA|nr:MAG: hypothetical protein A2276_06110 [candidate division WOR-1 bacterium RIFOXYA12_FULL_43_27]OGC20231.1 MAG: hypothetical protein A2292_04110 [candidate division WOR-1 bacterium RIFOXYB2_FULL_46_45]OGC32030.1 MAG: hypothetical protein A2232_07335 [candidate division WOR-1 bacterium RIFOXYA2_FULL_46_56]OGC39433.1 MAG: hypothetical protein A2438_07700 [candidate division WOR-1 bacterium RIFOXYC2_FULL_46_14]